MGSELEATKNAATAKKKKKNRKEKSISDYNVNFSDSLEQVICLIKFVTEDAAGEQVLHLISGVHCFCYPVQWGFLGFF